MMNDRYKFEMAKADINKEYSVIVKEQLAEYAFKTIYE